MLEISFRVAFYQELMTLLLLLLPQLEYPNTFLHLETVETFQRKEMQVLREAHPSSTLLGGHFWM